MATYTFYGASTPSGTQSVENDSEAVVVANAFYVPTGTTGYTVTGARLYIDPASTTSGTVTMYLWQGQDINPSLALREEGFVISGSGWKSVTWDTPVTMTANAGFYVGYTVSSNDYYSYPSPGTGAIAGQGALMLSPAVSGDWSRSVYRYAAAGETNTSTGGIMWSVDITVEDEPTPVALTVNVGADKTIASGATTSLTASASGGEGAKTYAWSVTSGPSTSGSQFSAATSASTDFTPTTQGTYAVQCQVTDTSGSASDSLTVTVTAPPPNTSTVSEVIVSTGWTATGGTVLAVLSDSDSDTYVTSSESPVGLGLVVDMSAMSPPAAGQGFQVTLHGLHYTETASTATAQVAIYNGATLRATSGSLPIPATATDTVFDFVEEDVESVDWADVRVVLTVTATT